jgi:hypothetical protein
MPLRCVIVDDSPSFSKAARLLLQRGGLVVAGVASTAAEALDDPKALDQLLDRIEELSEQGRRGKANGKP